MNRCRLATFAVIVMASIGSPVAAQAAGPGPVGVGLVHSQCSPWRLSDPLGGLQHRTCTFTLIGAHQLFGGGVIGTVKTSPFVETVECGGSDCTYNVGRFPFAGTTTVGGPIQGACRASGWVAFTFDPFAPPYDPSSFLEFDDARIPCTVRVGTRPTRAMTLGVRINHSVGIFTETRTPVLPT